MISSPSAPRHVAIIGGGVSGLATAHFVARSATPGLTVTLIEGAPTLGGKVVTRTLAGVPVDTGPDAFLARAPELAALVADLGLADRVRGPLASGAYIWSRNHLRPLPPGAMFGIPEKLWPLLKSGLLSPWGVLRAAGDFVLPQTKTGADPSVAELTRPRFGAEVFDRMIQPLLGGVHAGDANLLSAKSTVPEIAGLATKNRSLYLGIRSWRKKMAAANPNPGAKPKPPLVTIDGGLGQLIKSMAMQLGDTNVRTATTVTAVARTSAGYELALSDGTQLLADEVVLATPAYRTADLIAGFVPSAAELLRGIAYVDVASVTMAFDKSAVGELPNGTGFLMPPAEHEFIVGVSWLSAKWAHVADDTHQVFRVLVGRSGDSRWVDMTDEQIVATVRADLERIQGITAEPRELVVQRWPQGMPQYTVGHSDRLAALDAALLDTPGLHLTGAAYRGVGLAGCVAQARALATTLTTEVSAPAKEGADR